MARQEAVEAKGSRKVSAFFVCGILHSCVFNKQTAICCGFCFYRKPCKPMVLPQMPHAWGHWQFFCIRYTMIWGAGISVRDLQNSSWELRELCIFSLAVSPHADSIPLVDTVPTVAGSHMSLFRPSVPRIPRDESTNPGEVSHGLSCHFLEVVPS